MYIHSSYSVVRTEYVDSTSYLVYCLYYFCVQLKSLMDLTMMAFNPSHSRLRTEEEIYFLLEQTGFIEAQTYPTRAGYSIIEAFPTKQ